ncbi:MAG: arsenate reductase family protein [Oscillospiraceae bacterium]|jgi:arsenate reductase|nr:arsenate reductase family protein [Oscillospiraceae bacterium]
MVFLCYTNCSTCKKAKKWLEDHHIEFQPREIKTENPALDELRAWHALSGAPLKRFFNTSGLLYKELKLKDRLPEMREEDQLALLATDGMLVKRPLLIAKDFILIGFNEKQWSEKLVVTQ